MLPRGSSRPALLSARKSNESPRRSADFRTLYYRRQIVLRPPSVNKPGLTDDVKAFPIWRQLRRSKTELHDIKPSEKDVFFERALSSLQAERRGYRREPEVDVAVTPAFPIVTEHVDPVVYATPDVSDDGSATGSRRPSGFSDLDLDLASFFAHTEVFKPKPGSNILRSRRRNLLLYSKMYSWRPNSVTYRNFFLPDVNANRCQNAQLNGIKY